MQTLRRTIHPQVRVLDQKAGLVEYIASDESLDSYNEIVRADGARFDRFQKNAPFVDSHNYESIDCLLGQVVDYRVNNRRVIETVKWAIDVPSNLLAQKGFEMTAAGYLKAVSIGFFPVSYVSKWDNNPKEFQNAIEDLNGVDPSDVNTIYLEWQQIELSACVIGANPNAVAQIKKAYSAGILNDSDIEKFSRISADFARCFAHQNHRSRSYSFSNSNRSEALTNMLKALDHGATSDKSNSTATQSMKKENFLKNFNQLTGQTKAAFEDVEHARHEGGPVEIKTALRLANGALMNEQRSAGDPVEKYFHTHPVERYYWNAIARKLGGGGVAVGSMEDQVFKSLSPGLVPGSGVGFGSLPVAVSEDIFDLLLIYGAFKDLGVSQMPTQFTKFVIVNGLPTILVYPTDDQGFITTPVDNTLSGLNLGGPGVAHACNTFIGLIQASRELLSDQRVDLGALIFRLFFQAIAGAIDYCAFSGNGANDLTNAYQTGIFIDANIKANNLGAGHATIASLARTNFIDTVGLVKPAALQRPCRWYINPAFIPALMKLKEGDGPSWLLKTPAETGGEWHLVGFPVTWAAQAPGVELPNQKIAAFGEPNSYCVGIRSLFELMNSEAGVGFGSNSNMIRAVARGKCATRDATGFATLQLSA